MDPTKGIIRERCNCTSSTYHSLQTSLEKRLSNNFSMATHYTWSSFIDGASEVFNPSVAVRLLSRRTPLIATPSAGRSTYDRPHRFTINGVFELPVIVSQRGVLGKILGGWQVNGFLTLQSGAPFTVLNGSDPGGIVTGNLVGTSIRPFLNTNLDLSQHDGARGSGRGRRARFSAASRLQPNWQCGPQYPACKRDQSPGFRTDQERKNSRGPYVSDSCEFLQRDKHAEIGASRTERTTHPHS